VEKYGTAGEATDDNITRRIYFSCWVSKATDTQSEYVIRIAFPLQKLLREAPQCYVILTLLVLFITYSVLSFSLEFIFLSFLMYKRRLIAYFPS
jgi:hypothetical protein